MAKKISLLLLGLFLAGFLSILIFSSAYLSSFSRAAGLTKKEAFDQIREGFEKPYQDQYLTFLILGLDRRPAENTLLTDTILLAVVNTKTGNYLLFSVPRDLWFSDLKTKINALYYYGQKKDPNDGTKLVKQKLEEILDWPIDYTVLLEMNQVKQLIDLVGGVEVEVERSFVDEEFPKDDGSGEVMTIEFKAGKQIFDGEKALQFMRSRKSKDPIEGTDQARQRRQKKVILALKDKLINAKKLFLNPDFAGQLYRFLTEEIKTWPQIDLKVLASLWRVGLKALEGKQIEAEIPWQGEEALLIPGRDPIYHTWILEPKEGDWDLLKNYFLLLINELTS